MRLIGGVLAEHSSVSGKSLLKAQHSEVQVSSQSVVSPVQYWVSLLFNIG
jgi:hypothetical protein